MHESVLALIQEDSKAAIADVISIDELLAVSDFRKRLETKD